MAGSNGTGSAVDVKPHKAETLPFVSVSDTEARVLSWIVTLIFTTYLTVGLLALLFQKFGFLVGKSF